MTDMKHTPTPWVHTLERGDPRNVIRTTIDATEGEGSLVATGVWEAHDAAFIVQACNSHTALVEALRDAAGMVAALSTPLAVEIHAQARAALKLAEGEGS